MQDVMSVNKKEYEIMKLLGHGKGGYSYLAKREGNLYVLKQIHHEPCEYYSFGNKIEAEQNDYNRLLQTGIRIPRMLDIDIANERILKEYIDGPTIYDLVKNDAMKDLYLMQMREMAKVVYEAGLTMNVTIIWMNGILKIGGLSTGLRHKNLLIIWSSMKKEKIWNQI